ncbi:hypothetical protein [Streptomyces sp. NPDC059862]|uniref:hypothetical protein n=1 Tax=unclassified Streptomyces TaxID=2593676 RepID=UPI00362CBAFB
MSKSKPTRKDLKAARDRAAEAMLKTGTVLRQDPRFRPLRSHLRRATAATATPSERAHAREQLISAAVWQDPEFEHALAELDKIRKQLPWWKRIW